MKTASSQPRFAIIEFIIVLICSVASSIQLELAWFFLIVAGACIFLRIFWSESNLRKGIFDLLIILFLCTSLMGVLVAHNQSLANQKFFLIIGSTLLFFTLTSQPKNNIGLIVIILGIMGSFFTTLFYVNYNWLINPADIELLNQIGNWWTKLRLQTNIPTGLALQTFHANIIGGINAILLPLLTAAIVYFWELKNKSVAIFGLFILLFLTLGLVFSSSRGAWLAAFSGFVIFAAMNQKKLQIFFLAKKKVLSFLPLPIIILGVIGSFVFTRYSGEVTNPIGEITSLSSRIQIAHNTLYLISDFLFTGGGLGSFPGLYSQYILVIPFYMYGYSHNLYLDLALEQGIVGFALWICLTILCARLIISTITNNHKKGQKPLFAVSLYASLIVLLIHGIVDDPIYSNAWGLPLLFLVPGLSVAISDTRSQTLINLKKTAKIGIIGMAICVGLIFVFYRPTIATWYANKGAISMAKEELGEWPTGQWIDISRPFSYAQAESAFSKALTYQWNDQTANFRLGLIAMTRLDFRLASEHLEISYLVTPQHRGIQKSLGYCYTWLGEFDKALILLVPIPESHEEMQAYAWWWRTQGHDDLAENASTMANLLSVGQTAQ